MGFFDRLFGGSSKEEEAPEQEAPAQEASEQATPEPEAPEQEALEQSPPAQEAPAQETPARESEPAAARQQQPAQAPPSEQPPATEPSATEPSGEALPGEAPSDDEEIPASQATAEEQEKLNEATEKTRTSLFGKIGRMVRGKNTVDAEVLDRLEEVLVTSDVGVKTMVDIIDRVEARVERDKYVGSGELETMIHEEIAKLMLAGEPQRPARFGAELPVRPYVIMVVGVNGVGKTTTIGKLAHGYQQAGRSVLLGAADTYRAAAIEQLEIWAERTQTPLIKQKHGADPAAVAFDTVAAAEKRGTDVAIIDTAGRLHTRSGLMDELSKVKRVMGKQMAGAPHEVLLVLDASTGQNALRQAEEFTRSVEVTGLALTKLDGTAKGGIIIGVSNEFGVPVKYIGVGERMEDLQVFDRTAFVKALFSGRTVAG